MAKMIGSLAIFFDHLGLERAGGRQAEEDVGAFQRLASVRLSVSTACALFHWSTLSRPW